MNTEFETGASPAAASKPWLFLSVIIGALYLLFPTWIVASHLFLLLIVIAAVVTPPDIMSQLFLAIPLCLLYEVGLFVAPLFKKVTTAPEERTDSEAV